MAMNKKMLIGLAVTAIFLLSLFTPMLIAPASAADPSNWYTTVPGVLTSDYYVLYPYKTYSIDFGLSKFGEMINYPVTPGVGLGLQYPGYDKAGTYNQKLTTARDPFANEYIDPKYWINGWLIEIRYTHRTLRDRYIIAMAIFADMVSYGGDWLVGHKLPLSTAPYGGRKTNTYAETEDLKVLYNGPRLYVAESVTHIYDWFDGDGDGVVDYPEETWKVVDLVLKFVFDKVKKYVIIYKDVKQAISGKELDSPLDIQLSNREEWDLGPSPDYASYAHFFHQNFTTCYGPNWHTAIGIMREFVRRGKPLYSVPVDIVATDGTKWVGPIASGSVRVYVNGVWREPGRDYDINLTTGEITWKIDVTNAWVEVVYKLWKEGTYKKGVPHLYDVAQIISSDKKYVGFKAFWPVLSDYTVDGWALTFQPLIGVSEPDMLPIGSEPDIPLVIGEWDFMLGHEYPSQFRGVEVIGLTDWHDAVDDDVKKIWKLDREVRYQLDEVFNPWDLNDAVQKETKRWVEFTDPIPSTGKWMLRYAPVVEVKGEMWDQYCVFSERVIDLTENELEARVGYNWRGQDTYNVTYNPDGTMTISGLDVGHKYKILYSTIEYKPSKAIGRYEWIIVGRDAHTVDSAGASMVSAAFKNKIILEGVGAEIGLAGADMKETEIANAMPWVMHKFGTEGNTMDDYKDALGRAALKDDWCKTWPIASSNMIGVGGPLANMLAYYANDFMSAFYGLSEYACSAWADKVIALSCWSQKTYASSTAKGYAVISTYKDINGTVIFLVWGHWGRDTYYATKWFHEEGVYQLQEAPDCATAIILEIDYKDPEHPTFKVVEVLGTISETLWVHDKVKKGGIHEDP